MSIHRIEETYDIVVVGGSLSGICAAISAARHGARTAIVQNRSVFGGDASSEIECIVGPAPHAAKKGPGRGPKSSALKSCWKTSAGTPMPASRCLTA